MVGDEFAAIMDRYQSDVAKKAEDILSRGCQIGWLSEDDLSWNDWRDRYGTVKSLLLERVAELSDSTDRSKRQLLYEDLHGFIASLTTLYHAAGVEITVNIRMPDTNKLTRDDDSGRRRYRDFLNFIRHTVPKQAVYESDTGLHSLYRTLFEDDEKKLKYRLPVGVSRENPTADLTTSWVITGPEATALQDDIEEVLDAETDRIREAIQEGNETAPVLQIPVVLGDTRPAIRETVRELVDQKDYTLREDDAPPSQDVETLVRLLMSVLGTARRPHTANPYDVAEALLRIAASTREADYLTLSDIEAGLAGLSPKRLFPDRDESPTAIIQAVLAADEPIGRSEIVERAPICAGTYDRRYEDAATFDLMSSVMVNGHKKWTASLVPRWSDYTDRARPGDSSHSTLPTSAKHRDVLAELAVALDLDVHDLLSWPADIDAVYEQSDQAHTWRAYLVA